MQAPPKPMLASSKLMLISNHLRQFLSCDADAARGTAAWQWHPAPQPWNTQFQFQFLTREGGKEQWTLVQGFNEQMQVVWATGQPKVYIGWVPQRQELGVYAEITAQAIWTVKAAFQNTFTLSAPGSVVVTTLPELHLAAAPPVPLTHLQYQWIPAATPVSPGVLDYALVLFQDPYVMARKDGVVRVLKCRNKTLDVYSLLVRLAHVAWDHDVWRVHDHEPVDVYRSHGRQVVLIDTHTQRFIGAVEEGVGEFEQVTDACVYEFHKLPHSPLAFGLRSLSNHKYLGVRRGRLAWVQPTSSRFFWTFLVPQSFAAAIVDPPVPKMPKRMVVTMTAIISAAAIGAVTGITNFLMNI